MTLNLKNLNTKSWYRLLKVFYVFSAFLILIIGLLLIYNEHTPSAHYAKNNSYILCNDNRKFSLTENNINLYQNSITSLEDVAIKKLCLPPVPDDYMPVYNYYTNEIFNPLPTIPTEPNYILIGSYMTNGSWWVVIMYSVLFLIILFLIFELIKRIFYYIFLGSFSIYKNKKLYLICVILVCIVLIAGIYYAIKTSEDYSKEKEQLLELHPGIIESIKKNNNINLNGEEKIGAENITSNSGHVIVGTTSGKARECIEQWNEYYDANNAKFEYLIKDVTVDYSPKLDSCLSVYKRCDRDNTDMCFNRIDAGAEKYDGCNLGGDDPTDEEINAYFHYLITGEVLLPELYDWYIPKIKSECNISF